MNTNNGEKSGFDQYEEIARILKEREFKLSAVEKEIATIKSRLQEFHSARYVRAGAAQQIRTAETYRKSLQLELRRKLKHRDLVFDEVKKARERLEMLSAENN